MSQLGDMLSTIATIQSGIYVNLPSDITGGSVIATTFPYMPADPSQANVPFFYNEFKGGPSSIAAVTGVQQATSMFDMVLCADRTEAERIQADAVRVLCLWRDAVLAAFASNVRLGNMPSVVDAMITRVGQFEIIRLGSTEYFGMAFTLTVHEMYNTTITA